MDLKEVNEKIKGLSLPDKDKEAILDLIDIKNNENMKEVISEIKSLNTKIDASIAGLNTKFESSIGSLKNEISNIKWFIGAIIAIAAVLVRIFKIF